MTATATAVQPAETLAAFEVRGGPERLVYQSQVESPGGHFTRTRARWPGADPLFIAWVRGVAIALTERRELRFEGGGPTESIEVTVLTDSQRLFAAIEKGDVAGELAAHQITVAFPSFSVRMPADAIAFPAAERWPALFGREAPDARIVGLMVAYLLAFVPVLIARPSVAAELPHERFYRAARAGFEAMTSAADDDAAAADLGAKPARKRK